MSSKYVRDLFTTWLNDPAMTLPYHPTINTNATPTEAMWMMAEFNSYYRGTMTFCSGVKMESGEVEIIVFAPPGIGYNGVITALEADMKTLLAQRDPTQKLVIMELSAPQEYSGGSADEDYSMSVYADYVYYS